MKADVYSLEGKKLKQVELPKAFEGEVNENLIKRAVLSAQSARYQPSSPDKYAGRRTTAVYIGDRKKPQMHRTINIGKARKPRTKENRFLISGRVASIPAVVGGPRAHPPKTEKKLDEKINKKERRKAIISAIAASVDPVRVRARGHIFEEGMQLPVVVEDKFEQLDKTKDIRAALKNIKMWADVERARAKRKNRAGKGKKRGRPYKKAKSLLIVAGNTENIYKAARNLEGVDIIEARNINAELLAPGCQAGRLCVWTEGALKGV